MKNLLVLFFLMLPAMGLAQQTTINGSEHPELIPDSAAGLAVFSVHSMFDSPADVANTERHHAKLNLSPADHGIYDATMQTYFIQSQAQGAAPSGTLEALKTSLSTDGYAKLLSFVRAEKTHMQYHTQKPIQQAVSQ